MKSSSKGTHFKTVEQKKLKMVDLLKSLTSEKVQWRAHVELCVDRRKGEYVEGEKGQLQLCLQNYFILS